MMITFAVLFSCVKSIECGAGRVCGLMMECVGCGSVCRSILGLTCTNNEECYSASEKEQFYCDPLTSFCLSDLRIGQSCRSGFKCGKLKKYTNSLIRETHWFKCDDTNAHILLRLLTQDLENTVQMVCVDVSGIHMVDVEVHSDHLQLL